MHLTRSSHAPLPCRLSILQWGNAQVVDVVPEVQSVSLLGSTGELVYLSFLGQNITVVIGTDTPSTIQSSLESLVTVRYSHVYLRSDSSNFLASSECCECPPLLRCNQALRFKHDYGGQRTVSNSKDGVVLDWQFEVKTAVFSAQE